MDESLPQKTRRKNKVRRSPYYALPVAKLLVFHIATFGLFELYWMYRQWRGLRDYDRVRMHPFWRAWFSVLFAYSLFRDVDVRSREAQLPSIPVGFFAAMYIIGSLASNSSTLTSDGTIMIITELLSMVPVLLVQDAMNRHIRHCDPDADMNDAIASRDVVLVLVSLGLWVAIITGWIDF